MMGPAVQLRQVAVRTQGNTLLAPLDLTLPAGGWHGVAGPNGGGKSTLIKAIAGLHAHQGRITLHWPGGRPGQVGYMPQLAPFDPSLPITALDFMRMHVKKRPVWLAYRSHRAIEQAIEQVAIRPLLQKRMGTLSTGERQRVLLACTLINQPGLLLLDEPLAGLDAAGRAAMIALLQDFQQQGGTLIMIEHDRQVLERYCDSHILIASGQLVEHVFPSGAIGEIPLAG